MPAADAAASAEAAKRARRRAAHKANKKTSKQQEQEQRQKFLADKKQQGKKESGAEEATAEGEERKDGSDTAAGEGAVKVESSGGARVHIKTEQGVMIETEYIAEELHPQELNPALAEFAGVFERFQKLGSDQTRGDEEDGGEGEEQGKSKDQRIDEEIREQSGEGATNAGELSRRKQKERDRLHIEDLKQLVAKPDVVELHDANAADPKLLVYLKSYRNTVPVPMHWSQKRKFLQNKRGYEKPPFQLPACIENTGITKMRGAQQEKDATATNKQKQRAKMAPKMGKIDIDYQILHDAFFRYQTKPPMTEHGALYYEGREHEIKMTEKKPGHYSAALRAALGMTSDTSPPPWLLHMQRVGPPPAYPHLAIPGVSAPIPAGARYGFGEGEWGKPPVDAQGRPLYGDVFGIERRSAAEIEQIDTTLWGQLEKEADDEEEEEQEEQKEDGGDEPMETEAADPSGTQSVMSSISGLTTPEVLNLRKANQDGTGTETPDTVAQRAPPAAPKALYTVLEEKRTSVGAGLFGTQHTYVLPTAGAGMAGQAQPEVSEQERRVLAAQARQRAQVDVALNPEELEGLDAATLKRKYDARLAADGVAGQKQLPLDDDDEEEGQKKKRRKGGSKKDDFAGFKF